MSFLSTPNLSNDEYNFFTSMAVTDLERQMVPFHDGIFVFWIRKINNLPNISQIAQNIYLTHASSSYSHQDFPILKNILGRQGVILKDDITKSVLCVKDAFRPFEFNKLLEMLKQYGKRRLGTLTISTCAERELQRRMHMNIDVNRTSISRVDLLTIPLFKSIRSPLTISKDMIRASLNWYGLE